MAVTPDVVQAYIADLDKQHAVIKTKLERFMTGKEVSILIRPNQDIYIMIHLQLEPVWLSTLRSFRITSQTLINNTLSSKLN